GLHRRDHPRHRRGVDRVPAGLQHRPPHDHREAAGAAYRRPGGDRLHGRDPDGCDSRGGAVLPPRHLQHRADVGHGHRPSGGAWVTRLPNGVVRHRRVGADRDSRDPRRGPDHWSPSKSLVGRRGADRVERGDGARRARRDSAALRQGPDAARLGGDRRRAGAVTRTRSVAIRCDHLGRAVHRSRPRHCDADVVLPLDPGAAGSGGQGAAERPRGRHPRRLHDRGHHRVVRGGLCVGGVAAQVRGRPLDRVVRRVQTAGRRRPHSAARDRDCHPDV
ncbi:MAG: Undecaprenyl-diphosphatase, partial [uncultured Nocardioidaceae bacterium]